MKRFAMLWQEVVGLVYGFDLESRLIAIQGFNFLSLVQVTLM